MDGDGAEREAWREGDASMSHGAECKMMGNPSVKGAISDAEGGWQTGDWSTDDQAGSLVRDGDKARGRRNQDWTGEL